MHWTVALLAAVQPLRAQTPAEAPAVPEYRIEVIVFANTDFNRAEEDFAHRATRATDTGQPLLEMPTGLPVPLPLLDELLPATPESGAPPIEAPGATPYGAPPPSTEGAALTHQAPSPPPFRFRLLGPGELELGAAFASLRRLAAYTPLLHGGWIQEGLPPEQAHRFDLSLLGVTNLRGSIELYLSRFLHVDLDLRYQEAPAPVAGNAGGLAEFTLPPSFHLRSERRLRSGELHYFDHPAFGVLLMVRPVPAAGSAAQSPAA